MHEDSSICQICLRTDRKLSVVDEKLSEYHDEMCEYEVYATEPQFCWECGHLLRKMYNFKTKCLNAIKILKNWKKAQADRNSLNLLYTKLPISTLGVWLGNNSKIYEMCRDEEPTSIFNDIAGSDLIKLEPEFVSCINLPFEVPVLKLNMSTDPFENITIDYNEAAIQSNAAPQLKVHEPVVESMAESNKPFGVVLTVNKPVLKGNIPVKDSLSKRNVPVPVRTENMPVKDSLSKINVSAPVRKENMPVKDSLSKGNVPIKGNIPVVKVKRLTSHKNIKVNIPVGKTVMKVVDVRSLAKTSSLGNKEIVSKNLINLDASNSIENNSAIMDTTQNVFDDMLVKSEETVLKDLDYKNKELKNPTPFIDLTEYKLKSLNSDDGISVSDVSSTDGYDLNTLLERCDSDIHDISNDADGLKTLSELASINIKDDDFIDGYKNMNEAGKVNIYSDLEKTGKELQEICEIYSKILPKRKKKKGAYKRKREMRVMVTGGLEKFITNIDGLCETGEGLLKLHHSPNKEGLKLVLLPIIEDYNQKANGDPIDKEFLIDCIENKIPERIVSKLRKKILHDKDTEDVSAVISTITNILEKYKFDIKYGGNFDIEYLNTEKKTLQEFQKRKTYDCYKEAKYKCDVCYQVFKNKFGLDEHMKQHDVSAGEFSCDICQWRYPSKDRLRLHHALHRVVYKCTLCPYVTYHRVSMKTHASLHADTLYSDDKCNTTEGVQSVLPQGQLPCITGFSTKESLREHGARHAAAEVTQTWTGRVGIAEAKGVIKARVRGPYNIVVLEAGGDASAYSD